MKINKLLRKLPITRLYSCRSYSKKLVLGIETSCDDTAAAVVDDTGKILGQACNSQMKIHLQNGGVIPHIAVHLHQQNIKPVVTAALRESRVTLEDLAAIAVTTKPGLKGSLAVGLQYAKKIAAETSIPLIPIHHMEAHALTPRLTNEIPFPYLALLASGAHCQIALLKSLDEVLLLGNSVHNAPGEVLDKVARRLKLQNLPSCYYMSGGKAIDFMSKGGNPQAFKFPQSLIQYRDCNFSFSAFTSFATHTIEREEFKHSVEADGVIPSAKDLCASLLHAYSQHFVHRVHRAFAYCIQEKLLDPNHLSLVFSGGVACNTYIRRALQQTCQALKANFFPAPPNLCNDNGVMIAWNGIEKLRENIDILSNFKDLTPTPDCPLGEDISEAVTKAHVKVKVPKINVSTDY